jgi:plastocyanin
VREPIRRARRTCVIHPRWRDDSHASSHRLRAANRGVKIGEADERYFFGPQTQYANAGDTVTWTNGTDAPHTVTSDTGDELASDNLADGATFEHTFTAEGTFAYHCTIHSYMTGKIVVLAAGAALPATDTAGQAAPSGSNDAGFLVVLLAGLAAGGFAVRRLRPVPKA